MDDLKNFFCRNKQCPKYGIRGEENIRIRGTYGKNKTRLLYCTDCKKTFSERQGTVFFRSSLPDDIIVSIHEHVAEGNGMRKTSRLTKVHHQTVIRHTRLAGQHAEQLHDELVAFSPKDGRGSVRRKWDFVRKKELRRKQSG